MNYVKLEDLKPGDRIVADGGFTCIIPAQVCTVEQDEEARLFVPCFGPECDEPLRATGKQECRHYLDGQCDDDETCIGFTAS
jgi:hypothetical protein